MIKATLLKGSDSGLKSPVKVKGKKDKSPTSPVSPSNLNSEDIKI
jgi:hypothetical protein